MSIGAAFAEILWRLSASVGRGLGRTALGRDTYGPALAAARQRRLDGETLQARRERLIARRQMARRNHRAVSSIDRELRAVTHDLLRGRA